MAHPPGSSTLRPYYPPYEPMEESKEEPTRFRKLVPPREALRPKALSMHLKPICSQLESIPDDEESPKISLISPSRSPGRFDSQEAEASAEAMFESKIKQTRGRDDPPLVIHEEDGRRTRQKTGIVFQAILPIPGTDSPFAYNGYRSPEIFSPYAQFPSSCSSNTPWSAIPSDSPFARSSSTDSSSLSSPSPFMQGSFRSISSSDSNDVEMMEASDKTHSPVPMNSDSMGT